MLFHPEKLRNRALDYMTRINGSRGPYDLRIADALIDSIRNSKSADIDIVDFELVVNQFFNLLYFGPITQMELFLTESCNLACDYCFIRSKKPAGISRENLIKALNFLVFFSGDRQQLSLTLFGGEPLLKKELILDAESKCEEIQEKSGKNISISITTNGTLMDEDLLKKSSGRIHYLLSIDGLESAHDRNRKFKDGKGSFGRVVEKIPLLKRYQPWIGVRMTIPPENAGELMANVDGLHKFGVNQFLLGPVMDMDWTREEILAYEEQLLSVGKFYLERRKEGDPLRITFFETGENEPNCQESKWGCGAGRNTISVGIDGSIYPCSKFLGYAGADTADVRLGSLHEGITNIALRKSLAQASETAFTSCTSCSLKNACAGGCPADNYLLNKSLYTPGTVHCRLKASEQRVLAALRSELDKL